MRTLRHPSLGRGLFLATLACASDLAARGQVPYPDHTIQNVEWTTGTHHTAVTQPIRSPGAPTQPVAISAAADAEFVSGAQVHLTDGFHAGAFDPTGRFRAYLDAGIGATGDVVTISPDPATHLVDNVLHIEKWEKFEIGVRLPADYQAAVDDFFSHYYSNGVNNDATVDQLDREHDLNPYADDSLILVINLTSPTGVHHMKWGFFMKEAMWATNTDSAQLAEDFGHPYHPYHIHFRFAPNEEGPWTYTLSIRAPHTRTLAEIPLPPLYYTGFGFQCDPPLPDNHGFMQVNQVNKRTLEFDDGTGFFGLGTNMADIRHGAYQLSNQNPFAWMKFYQRDFTEIKRSMEQLHSVGGNFLRMWLMRGMFSPEWVNLGVYDHYVTLQACSKAATVRSSCQFEGWAFDRILDHARANNLYLQLCVDPAHPQGAYETHIWGAHPYVINFVEPTRDPGTGLFDAKQFLYSYEEGEPVLDRGAFYYWKRKYKYVMSRWGYSVNIAAFETFNEIDQMLTYRNNDLTPVPGGDPHNNVCPDTRVFWPADPAVPGTVDRWHSDLLGHVKGAVDPLNPTTSPLGETDRLFSLSFTDAEPASDLNHYAPLRNSLIDLADVHKYMYENDQRLRGAFDNSQDYRNNFTTVDSAQKRPFHNGEFNYFAYPEHIDESGDTVTYEANKIFDNYDVTFHNEIWASTFFGNFSTGLTW
ncbi:MAG: hypothetical protein JNM91_09075, partial [Flavobacteriales bacterium]|nr:hypothetical protein [Flavobacteriales bacterium]